MDPSFDQPLAETLPRKQLWLLLVSLMLAMFVSGLNQSLVATATPKMLADLGGFSLLAWVFTIYLMTSTVVAPLVGKLSDMYGRKIFLLAGLCAFVVASAGCGSAPSMPVLIAFRGLQGVGGGIVMACVMAALGDLFSPAERGKYMGLFTGTMTVAGLSGPSIGGLITDHVTWRGTFFVNVPVVVVAAFFIWIGLPTRKRGGRLRDVDFVGSVLLSAGTALLLLGLVWAQERFGWDAAETLALFGASAIFIALFVVQETRHRNAVLPPFLFKNREFALVSLMTVFFGAAMMGASQYLPTFVQTSLKASATASGLVTTPQSIGMLLTSVVGGQLISRRGKYKGMILLGIGIGFSATLLLQRVGVGEPRWHIAAFMILMGFGSGLVMPTVSVVSQNAVAQQYIGVASGARQFFMQIGGVIGVTAFGVVLTTSYTSSFEAHLDPGVQAAVPAPLMARFDDPTLALNARQFAAVKAEFAALEGGDALLADAVEAQREGVATAIRQIYRGSSLLMLLALLTAVGLKGLPLRRSGQAAAATAAAKASPQTADRALPPPIPFPLQEASGGPGAG